jgi:hypothetical protein
MSFLERVKVEFGQVLKRFDQSEPLQRILGATITPAHYASFMRQVFHHTRENPQIQALATVYFRGNRRRAIKTFYKHATSEIGHDQLALKDLETLGHNTAEIPLENPLPATTALLAFPFYQIYNLNPVGYLGYLFFLEFTPTTHGALYLDGFERSGVPRSAMTFLLDHTTIDQGHNKLMEQYFDELVLDERDLGSIVYAMRVSGRLYSNMIQEALDQVDQFVDWGTSTEEAGRAWRVET